MSRFFDELNGHLTDAERERARITHSRFDNIRKINGADALQGGRLIDLSPRRFLLVDCEPARCNGVYVEAGGSLIRDPN